MSVTLHQDDRRRSGVALVGEALVDQFPDRTVVGGAPFNVARNLAALGEWPLMVTRIGSDAASRRIEDEFDRFRLTRAGLQHDPARPTGTVRILLDADGHRFDIADDVAWDAIDATIAADAVRDASPAVVCFGTLAQRRPSSRAAVRGCLDATPAWRLLDLNLRPGSDDVTVAFESLGLADAVKVNTDELSQLLVWFDEPFSDVSTSAGCVAAAGNLLRHFVLDALIVTRGVDGYVACRAGGEVIVSAPGAVVPVVDTVGAGDAFTSVVILGRVRGWPFAPTLARAAEYASAVCTFRGAASGRDDFYRDWRVRWDLVPADARMPRSLTS